MSGSPTETGVEPDDPAGETVAVLHIDDDAELLDVASRLLERSDETFSVTSAESAEEGLAILEEQRVDCVVSDYEMPGMDGLEFLRVVRETNPRLPFVLFTGQGSEGVASEAISADLTDYVRKHAADPYGTLANRIRNAVDRRRTRRRLDRLRRRHELVAEASADAFVEWDLAGRTVRLGEEFQQSFGYSEAGSEQDVEWWTDRVHPDDRDRVADALSEAADEGDDLEVHHRFQRGDGDFAHVISRGSALGGGTSDGSCRIVGALVDESDRVEHERKLTALHEATQSLLRADTETDVAEAVTDAAVETLDLPEVVVRLFDPAENVLRPAAASSEVTELVADLELHEPGSSLTWEAFASGELAVFDDVTDSDAVRDPDTSLRSALVVPLGEYGTLSAASPAVAAFDETTTELAAILGASAEAALDRIARADDLAERTRELRDQEVRFEELSAFNEVFADVQKRVARAEDPGTLESYLCERLADLDRVAFAWVGTPDEIRASAGDGDGYLDEVFGEDGAADAEREPTVRCSPGSPVDVPNVGTSVQGSDWRAAALEAGFQSATSVPMVHDDRDYGALTVYAESADAFDERTREGLADLARSVAHGIAAIETKRSLHADTTVELELSVAAPADLLQTLASRTGSPVSLVGSVPTNGETKLFVTVDGTDPDAVRAAASGLDADLVDVVTGEEVEPVYELVTTDPGLVESVVERGAVPRTLDATPSGTRAVVELPGTVDVRGVVERLQGDADEVELVARRETGGRDGDGRPLGARVFDDLTERQQEVLQTAYFSGYFEWPRLRSGENVAETLSIAQPTFHRHLRACHRTVLSAVLEQSSDGSAHRTRKP